MVSVMRISAISAHPYDIDLYPTSGLVARASALNLNGFSKMDSEGMNHELKKKFPTVVSDKAGPIWLKFSRIVGSKSITNLQPPEDLW